MEAINTKYFSTRDPITEIRMKNNRRLLESIMKESAEKRVQRAIAEYIEEKATPY